MGQTSSSSQRTRLTQNTLDRAEIDDHAEGRDEPLWSFGLTQPRVARRTTNQTPSCRPVDYHRHPNLRLPILIGETSRTSRVRRRGINFDQSADETIHNFVPVVPLQQSPTPIIKDVTGNEERLIHRLSKRFVA